MPEEEKTRRIVALNRLQTEGSLQKNAAAIGEDQEVLVEEIMRDRGIVYARNDGNKIVTLALDGLRPGDFLNVRIMDATPHQLKGERK
ncbi:MAG: TRAM domain-containing protein [Elusimicrobia bacterium]|nr:TRAM domain-containing protein [Elusimicrobiota bacterium]